MNSDGIERIHGGNLGSNRIGVDTNDGGNTRYGRSIAKTTTVEGNAFDSRGAAQSTTPSAFSGFSGTVTLYLMRGSLFSCQI